MRGAADDHVPAPVLIEGLRRQPVEELVPGAEVGELLERAGGRSGGDRADLRIDVVDVPRLREVAAAAAQVHLDGRGAVGAHEGQGEDDLAAERAQRGRLPGSGPRVLEQPVEVGALGRDRCQIAPARVGEGGEGEELGAELGALLVGERRPHVVGQLEGATDGGGEVEPCGVRGRFGSRRGSRGRGGVGLRRGNGIRGRRGVHGTARPSRHTVHENLHVGGRLARPDDPELEEASVLDGHPLEERPRLREAVLLVLDPVLLEQRVHMGEQRRGIEAVRIGQQPVHPAAVLLGYLPHGLGVGIRVSCSCHGHHPFSSIPLFPIDDTGGCPPGALKGVD